MVITDKFNPIAVKIRKSYVKPKIEIVALRPKETILGVCKSLSIVSNEGEALTSCYSATVCSLDT